MNSLPSVSNAHAQPLDIDLVLEEYDNIQVGKFYYVRQRTVDPSGVVIWAQDHVAVVLDKGATSIGVDIKMTRHESSGPSWTTSEEELVQLFERTDAVTFHRPLLMDAETEAEVDADSSDSDSVSSSGAANQENPPSTTEPQGSETETTPATQPS